MCVKSARSDCLSARSVKKLQENLFDFGFKLRFLNDLRDLDRPFHMRAPVLTNDFSFFPFESTQHNNVGLMQTWFYSYSLNMLLRLIGTAW